MEGADGSLNEPFVLVNPPKHCTFEELVPLMGPSQQLEHSAEEIQLLRKGLKLCAERMAILDPKRTSFLENEALIDDLENPPEVPFHWRPFPLPESKAAMDFDGEGIATA